MAEKFYNTKPYKHDPRTYSGRIYNYDFDNHLTMADIAERIAADRKFDTYCKKNSQNRIQRDNCNYSWKKKGNNT